MGRGKKSNKNRSGSFSGAGKGGNSTPPASPLEPPLPQEDALLWAEVTKSLTPLKEAHDRLHFGPLLDEKPSRERQWSKGSDKLNGTKPVGPKSQAQNPRAQGGGAGRVNPIAQIADLGGFSRREMRQIDSGRQPIEARLDLHGMVQAAAHGALRGFLANSQARGLRHVLVITGKGRPKAEEDLFFNERETGVLRRMVPLWLAEPDLRTIVAGFNEAPRRHGGEGALYIRLRRTTVRTP